MSVPFRRFAAAAAAVLLALHSLAAAGAQETGAAAPAAPAPGEAATPPPAGPGAITPPAAAAAPVGLPRSPGVPDAAKEGRKPVGWLGCTRACPICLRSCELYPGHYGDHMCSEGHRF